MKLLGWHRLLLVGAFFWLLIVAGYTAPMLWRAPVGYEGDLIRSALLIWALTTAAALVLGYAVAWALRGFHQEQPR